MKSRVCIPAHLCAAMLALPALLPAAHAEKESAAAAAASAPLAAASAASAASAPASAPAPSVATPPLAPRFGFDGVLLGGFIEGEWVAAAALQESGRYRPWQIQGGEECSIHHFTGALGEPCTVLGGRGEGAMPVQTPTRTVGAGDALLTLVGADFPPQPRPLQLLSTGNATYQKFVARHLVENGLRGARPHIEQLIRVDLDGDGADEVLIAAQNVVDTQSGAHAELFSFAPDAPLMRQRDALDAGAVPATARAGSYSVVLLRWLDGDSERTVPLASSIGAPQPRVHRIAAIADLNGDGAMEIICAEASHATLHYSVHEIEGPDVRRVLNAAAH